MLTTARTAITPELFLLRARESCNGCLEDELDSTTLHSTYTRAERWGKRVVRSEGKGKLCTFRN